MDKNYGYKHTKWFLAFIIFTTMGLIVVANSQTASVDVTGNLVNNTQTATSVTSTWQNAVFQSSLTCWAAGDPGYCGPNPIVRPDGNINFSYGMVDLHQRVNVSKALPYGGTGLVVTGFNFGWTSKNGNGWDDGRQDVLSAYVKLYSSGDKKVIESFNYNLNYLHDWTSYNWSANWVNTKLGYRENQVGNVQFGFVGMDNNYWAGPYGPEVRDVSFQLKYKPDPCKNNPLYSPECPNFTQELAKANSIPITDPIKTTSSNTDMQDDRTKETKISNTEFDDGSKEEGAKEYIEDRLTDTLFKIFDDQIRQEEKSLDVAQEAVNNTEKVSDRVTKQAESIAKESQNRSIKESIEFKPEQVQTNTIKKESQENIFSLIQGPNANTAVGSVVTFNLPGPMLQNFSLKDNKENDQQVNSSSATNNSYLSMQKQISVITNVAVNKIEQEQNNINFQNIPNAIRFNTTMMNSNIITSNDNLNQSSQSVTSSETLQNQLILPKQLSSVSIVVEQSLPSREVSFGNTTTEQSATLNIQEPQTNQTNPLVFDRNKSSSLAIELPMSQNNFLTNKADPINEIIESKSTQNTEQKQDSKIQTVKQNVQDNDVADTGIRMAQLAIAPIGFNQYSNFILQDAAFYAPKEIYRSQKTVDNVRALRQLASDRLHQQMVNQQYLPR